MRACDGREIQLCTRHIRQVRVDEIYSLTARSDLETQTEEYASHKLRREASGVVVCSRICASYRGWMHIKLGNSWLMLRARPRSVFHVAKMITV